VKPLSANASIPIGNLLLQYLLFQTPSLQATHIHGISIAEKTPQQQLETSSPSHKPHPFSKVLIFRD
jgi:hypothetical protein